jgi:hypothetical protein
MDLPVNFPPGTKFWQVTIDAFADLTNGEFMLQDGSIVSGQRAERLRKRIARDGVEISEEVFRKLAPPSLHEWAMQIHELAKGDPVLRKAIAALLTEEDFKKCEEVAWDALRNAPDPEDRRGGLQRLLKIVAKKQNVGQQ